MSATPASGVPSPTAKVALALPCCLPLLRLLLPLSTSGLNTCTLSFPVRISKNENLSSQVPCYTFSQRKASCSRPPQGSLVSLQIGCLCISVPVLVQSVMVKRIHADRGQPHSAGSRGSWLGRCPYKETMLLAGTGTALRTPPSQGAMR